MVSSGRVSCEWWDSIPILSSLKDRIGMLSHHSPSPFASALWECSPAAMESYHETVNGSNVDIWIEADEPRERFLEPVTCGVPWPRGKLREDSCLILRDDGGEQVPLQTRILDRWPDGSVRWLLLDWQASVRVPAHYRLGVSIPKESIAPIPGGIQIERKGRHTTISTGAV